MPKTKDALKILDRLTGNDSPLREQIERETVTSPVWKTPNTKATR